MSDVVGTVAQQLILHASWNTGQNEVICMCRTRENNILTGHESLVIIWSVDGKTKPLSATRTATTSVDGCVTCIRQFPVSSQLALSANKTISVYDFTVSNGSISSLALKDQFSFNKDEINEIDIHAKESYICACDDRGEVIIIDLDNKKLLRVLSKFHDNICPTVRFLSRKPWELVSAGLDTKIARWDWRRGRLLAGVSTREGVSKTELMVNPPMVHSMAILQSHNCVACGLGDGRVQIYSIKSPRGIDPVCEIRPHLSSVACVCCVEGGHLSDDKPNNCLVSVGNDGTICVLRIDSNEDVTSYGIHCEHRLEGIAKVNGVDVLGGDCDIVIYTADVTGNVSVYSYN